MTILVNLIREVHKVCHYFCPAATALWAKSGRLLGPGPLSEPRIATSLRFPTYFRSQQGGRPVTDEETTEYIKSKLCLRSKNPGPLAGIWNMSEIVDWWRFLARKRPAAPAIGGQIWRASGRQGQKLWQTLVGPRELNSRELSPIYDFSSLMRRKFSRWSQFCSPPPGLSFHAPQNRRLVSIFESLPAPSYHSGARDGSHESACAL